MRRATLKGLLAHKLRLALTAAAIVIGVSFVAATFVLTDTLDHTFENLFEDLTAGVDVSVRGVDAFGDDGDGPPGAQGDGRERIPDQVLEEVRRLPGVRAAEGGVGGHAQLVDKKGDAISPPAAPTIGASWVDLPDLSPLTIRRGRAPRGPAEVVIDAATARRERFSLGDRVQVLSHGPAETFTVVGVAGFGQADNLAGATLAAFDLPTAQRILGSVGRLDTIEVAADEDVPAAVVQRRISAVLPPGAEAVLTATVAAENTAEVKEGLRFLRIALLVFAGVSLFVGTFVIFNTFSIIVAQRSRELALLRALGASRGQVSRSVQAEALIVGLVASALGLGVGWAVAVGLQSLLRALGIDLPTAQTQFRARTAVVSIGVGVLVTWVAAVVPAVRASRVAPLAAMREMEPAVYRFSRRRLAAGAGLTALSVAVLLFGLFAGVANPAGVVGIGAVGVFLGVAALSPGLARPLARGIGAPLPRLFGPPGKLGRENAMRNPRRTASTAAALMIGLGLMAFVGVFAASIKASATAAIDAAFRADFIVQGGGFSRFSPEVAAALRRDGRVGTVSEWRGGRWRDGGRTRSLAGVEVASLERVVDLDVRKGAVRGLAGGGVLVHEDEAERRGLEVGERIPMRFARSGLRQVEVAGIFAENRLIGDEYLVSLETFEDNFSDQLDVVVLVKARPGTDRATARRAVDETLAAFPNVDVDDQAEFKELQAGKVDQLLGLMSALLGLAVLIALFGIANTLALSIFERTRELGLLRAVGMTRRQVRSMIRWEAVIIAVLGAVLGVAVGVFFAWAFVLSLGDEGFGQLAVPGRQLLLYVALAGVAGMVAAVLPARRAARLDVLAAIAHQ